MQHASKNISPVEECNRTGTPYVAVSGTPNECGQENHLW